MRIGKKFPNSFFTDDGESVEWYHPKCMFEQLRKAKATTKKIESEDDLEGFSTLADDEQDQIKELMKEFAEYLAGKGKGKKSTPKKKPADSPKKTDTKKQTDTKKAKADSDDGKTETETEREDLSKIKKTIIKAVDPLPSKPKSKWKLTEARSGKDIPLHEGHVTLGRGDLLGIADVKCSRKQVDLEVSDSTLKIKRNGVNDSFMWIKDHWVELERYKQYNLPDQAKISLVFEKYQYVVSKADGSSVTKATEVKSDPDVSKSATTANKQKDIKADDADKQKDTDDSKKKDTKPAAAATEKKKQTNTDKKQTNKKTDKPKKQTKPKKDAATVSLDKKKKKKSASSEEDEKLPNEYDLDDSFIDDANYEGSEHGSDDDRPAYKKHHPGPHKPMYDEFTGSDDSEDENFEELQAEAKAFEREQTKALKRKYGDENDDREPCMYGAACYRKNPAHRAEFWHPPRADEPPTKKQKTNNNNNNAENEDAEQEGDVSMQDIIETKKKTLNKKTSSGGGNKKTNKNESGDEKEQGEEDADFEPKETDIKQLTEIYGDKNKNKIIKALKQTKGDVEKAGALCAEVLNN